MTESARNERTHLKLDDTEPSLVIPVSDSTRGAGLESIKRMTRAVLYARVSSDTQQKEATIESQLFELRRQIATAGHALIKEYTDDGISGTFLERPALEQLRQDAKNDLFDRIYFHAADRIARRPAHQDVIIDELLKRGKQITIGGTDYRENPENKLTLNLLGLFSEYERAKIIERTTRGRLHKLRMGEMSSNGHRIYGYHYVKKTPTAPATLAVNEEQAAIVRQIFEMFASGDFGIITIARFLEERRIPTRMGRPQWDRGQIKFILKNETYTGTRYFNRITAVTEANRKGKKVVRGKWVFRDRAEWISVRQLFNINNSRSHRYNCPDDYLHRLNDDLLKPINADRVEPSLNGTLVYPPHTPLHTPLDTVSMPTIQGEGTKQPNYLKGLSPTLFPAFQT
jgi:DNA invertase Pin-like site-specific DNA recombinase